jgi:TM2 domain-containing membrane protein YozV
MSTDNLIQPDDARPSLPPPRPGGRPAPPKNPILAMGLSVLVPGIGQAYNGQTAKAFVFFLGFFSAVYSVVVIDPLPYAFLIPFVYFWGLVDAYRSADLINLRAQGGVPTGEDDVQESPAWGATLVILGAVILASNLGWLNLASLHRFWPVLLIGFGLLFMWRSVLGRKGAN